MLPVIPADKANHFAYGAVISAIGSILAGPLAGLALAAVFGILKELKDYLDNRKAAASGLLPPHGVELADALWTAAGGLVVFAPSAGITMVISRVLHG